MLAIFSLPFNPPYSTPILLLAYFVLKVTWRFFFLISSVICKARLVSFPQRLCGRVICLRASLRVMALVQQVHIVLYCIIFTQNIQCPNCFLILGPRGVGKPLPPSHEKLTREISDKLQQCNILCSLLLWNN